MRRVRKLVAAILGGLTATAVVAVARMAGVEPEPELAGLMVLVAASTSTYLAPANELPT
jgi:energy-converting hydrogenase Eha subunit B